MKEGKEGQVKESKESKESKEVKATRLSASLRSGTKPSKAIREAFNSMWVVDGVPGVWTYAKGCGKDTEPKSGQVKAEVRPGSYALLELDKSVNDILSKVKF